MSSTRRASRHLRPCGLAAFLAALATAAGCGTIDRMTGVTTACDLRAGGLPARAEILAVWDTGISLNDEPVIGLRVRVMPLDAPDFEAEIPKALIGRLQIPQFQPGKIVPVVYARTAPVRVGLDVYPCD